MEVLVGYNKLLVHFPDKADRVRIRNVLKSQQDSFLREGFLISALDEYFLKAASGGSGDVPVSPPP